jgi:hypothetical protein
MSMTSNDAPPDTDIETMTLEEISRELAAYRPGNAAEVIAIEEWLARRMQLWRRLDELAGVRKPAAATPPQRGTQQA